MARKAISSSDVQSEVQELIRGMEAQFAALGGGDELQGARVFLQTHRRYRWSDHYVFQTVAPSGRHGPRLLVKQIKVRDVAGRTQLACRSASHPAELEFRALRAIHSQVAVGGASRIGAVRPVALVLGSAAVVMGYESGQNLRGLFGASALPVLGGGAVATATRAAESAGRLLAEIHRMPPNGLGDEALPVVSWRRQLDEAGARAFEIAKGWPVESLIEEAVEIAAKVATSAEFGGTPVLLHGDLYPDNFILSPDGRVIVVDTLLNQRGFPEEDVAKFIAGVEGLKQAILGGEFVCRLEVRRMIIDAFLSGYSKAGVLRQSRLEVFRLIALLRRWVEFIENLRIRLPTIMGLVTVARLGISYLDERLRESIAALRAAGFAIGTDGRGGSRVGVGRRPRVLDLINTDRSARELLDWRVGYVNARGSYENAIYCGPGEYVAQLREAGHHVHVIDQPRDLAPWDLCLATWRTWRLLRRERYTIIHTHGSVIGLVARVAALLGRTELVVHQVHGWHHHSGMGFFTRRVFVLVERMLALGTDRLLFQNAADIEECRRCGIAPERKLVWVGNGIQLGNFGATARAETERVRILCVARLEPVKNHRMLIGAVLLLRARGIEFDLQLVGDGVLRGELETIVREKQLAGSVHFLGYRNDVPDLTRTADICVLTSQKEGLPRAIIEAAASGRPVVATDVIGNRDVVVEGRTGFLVPLGDEVQLADRLEELIRDSGLRKRLGDRGREHALQHFDERAVTERIMAVYDELIAMRRSTAATFERVQRTPGGDGVPSKDVSDYDHRKLSV